MKNLFLIAVFLLSLTTSINAKSNLYETKDVKTFSNELTIVKLSNVNSFCKLIQMGDYNAVKKLIESGTDVNQKSVGMTPLMYAARHNKAVIAKLLIDNGANLKAKSSRGFTAMKYAELSNAKDAIEVLQQALLKKRNSKKRNS